MKYKINNEVITVPMRHKPTRYHNKYPMYDKFLPILAKHIPEGKIIVDVGANVGDTAIAMAQTTKNKIICIEPDPKMFKYLSINANDRMLLIKDRAGEGTDVRFPNLGLVKIDTDGSDFLVILRTDLNQKPIIFFENYLTAENKNGYKEAYKLLKMFDYSYSIFDNYGNLMIRNAELDQLLQINEYIIRSDRIYYTDVVAWTKDKRPIVDRAITEWESIFKKF